MAKRIKKTDSDRAWNRRKGGAGAYKLGSRIVNAKRFLIVCEGENTEPCYFKSFPVLTAEVESFGIGRSKTSLVKYALDLVSLEKHDSNREVWIVFDMDFNTLKEPSLQKSDFNEAITLARVNGFRVAYSNDAFELWFLLHYKLLESALTRIEYYEQIGKLWSISYERQGKGVQFCRGVYDLLLKDPKAHQINAIRNAERLHLQHGYLPPADQNPCTTVYQLVAELNKHLKT